MTSPYHKIFALTPPAIRRRFYVAFVLIGIVGVLEVFSLSTLLAFFSVGVNGSSSGKWTAVRAWLSHLNTSSSSSFLLALTLLMFIATATVTLLIGRHSYRTATATKEHFQNQLFRRFLYLPFHEQAGNKSSDWVRSVSVDCNSLEGRFIMPLLVLFGEIIPSLLICCVLLVVNMYAFIAAIGIFTVVGATLFLSTHRRLVQLGQKQQVADGNMVQSTQQAFLGLRELTIYGLQPWAQKRFQGYTNAAGRAIDEALFISLLPRFSFEVAVYLSLGVVFVVYAMQGTPMMQVVGEFAVFGAAAMRLLPSVSKVVSHLQSLRHARPAIVAIAQCLYDSTPASARTVPANPTRLDFDTLRLQDAGFAYNEHTVFTSLNLDIVRGDVLGIIGASGSGKSTLINMILGLLPSTHGVITLNGSPLAGQEAAWWSCIGYVPQEPFLMDASVVANIMLGNTSYQQEDEALANELLDRLQLPASLKDAKETIGENGARLSGGQRQRIAIARALCRRPHVLILDEATSAMDVQTQTIVMQVIAEYMRERTVLMITHRAETLMHCNKILKLPEGRFELVEHAHA